MRSYYNEHKNLVELESVGAWLDTETLTIYPMMKNGEYFEDEGISLMEDEFDEDWWLSLSNEDTTTLKGICSGNEDMPGFEGTWESLNNIKL